MSASVPGAPVTRLFAAYGTGDLDAVRSALAGDLVAYVTNAEGGADVVHGREAYGDEFWS